MKKISRIEKNFIIVGMIFFAMVCVSTWQLVETERENDILKSEIKSYEAKLYDCNDTVLTVRAAHQWVPLLEQTLPNLIKREMDALAYQIKQAREKNALKPIK